MKKQLTAFFLWKLVALTVWLASGQEAEPTFEPLRFNEDYSYVRSKVSRNLWESIKYIPLIPADDWYLSLGGEVRQKFEYFNNPLFGQTAEDQSGYLLQRYLLHADLHLSEHVRLFAEIMSALEDGKREGPLPVDEDRLDLHQGFIDIVPTSGDPSLTFRLGRQELSFGSERLISTGEGPNVRTAFQGGGIIFADAARRIKVDAFWMELVQDKFGVFDDEATASRRLWGVYATVPFPGLPSANLDLYYLGTRNSIAAFEQTVNSATRHTLGTRFFGSTGLGPGTIDCNWEAIYQFGGYDGGNIQAWSISTATGYTFDQQPLKPHLGMRIDVASGDRNSYDDTLGTFDPLYPVGTYFGESGILGPSNFFDVQPGIRLQLTANLQMLVRWTFFWRQSTGDGIYDPAQNLIRASSGSDARFVGSESSILLQWSVNRFISIQGAYSHFFTGEFLEQTGPSRDIDYFQVQLQTKF